ncbi:caffeoylshikimate esterase-like isoform X2 [Magnolia sinica]|uniref:caffeoylshikimate esterase-like isoform X2 n=1 Tax=Magnolia sinica TaxID=86752 RepID=UPI002659D27D|nr:caffeoylshikimate esterase-like isoform X2 [Magnolia sinica]
MAQDLENVTYEEEFISNPRGLKLFTCRWTPIQDPKALIFLCHGYGMECSISMKGTGIRLAKAGFAVYGIDYEGHGKSSGLEGYVPSFDDLVNDCSDYFTSVCEKKENKKKLKYLLGESMGGAVALLLHRKKPKYWDGAVLVAPMCKVRSNPYCYKGRPRLKTGNQLLMASLEIEKNLDQVSLPFIIVHGGDDTVTDPSVSKLLYESAASTDKTFKLYPGMWHALTSGEPLENIELVFSDIIGWLDERTIGGNSNSERDRKAQHDYQFLHSQGEKTIVVA